jgi:ABC-type multidrug transport system permease subunit
MVMFTLLVLFTSGSVLLVIERRQGLLRRLASAPLSRGAVVLGKWGSRMGLGMVQIAFAMLAGTVLFRVDWGPHLPVLFLVLFMYGGLGAALGMLLGNLARTEGQAVGIGVLVTNIIAPLGGCWWPIEVTPEFMQRLALVFPTGWAMDALHKLVSFGEPPASVIPHLVVMGAATLAVGALSARTFRFQ